MSGPPESPGTSFAVVATRLASFEKQPSSCCTLIVRLRATTLPLVTMSLPAPLAFPTARAAWPTFSLAEFPVVAVARLDAPSSFSSAMSSVGS